MRRLGLINLLLVGLVLIASAAPYTVSHFISRAQGPFTMQAVHQDGTVSTMYSDVAMKLPTWLVLPPGARIAAATTTHYDNKPDLGGTVDFVAPMQVDALKQYFTVTLTQQGFVVQDKGLGPLDARTAAAIGVSGEIGATRAQTGELIRIVFREEEGWFGKSRQIQLGWKKQS
jgi:hypothetical protein